MSDHRLQPAILHPPGDPFDCRLKAVVTSRKGAKFVKEDISSHGLGGLLNAGTGERPLCREDDRSEQEDY